MLVIGRTQSLSERRSRRQTRRASRLLALRLPPNLSADTDRLAACPCGASCQAGGAFRRAWSSVPNPALTSRNNCRAHGSTRCWKYNSSSRARAGDVNCLESAAPKPTGSARTGIVLLPNPFVGDALCHDRCALRAPPRPPRLRPGVSHETPVPGAVHQQRPTDVLHPSIANAVERRGVLDDRSQRSPRRNRSMRTCVRVREWR